MDGWIDGWLFGQQVKEREIEKEEREIGNKRDIYICVRLCVENFRRRFRNCELWFYFGEWVKVGI